MTKPVAVANWFVNNLSDHAAGAVVTHLQVQKLLYFAQAWHLMALDRPLFDEDMQAWPHGPVVPSVWHEFKRYGWQPIVPGGASEGIDADSLNILEQVRDAYGSFAAKKLEAMTHSERPWISARGGRDPEERCEEVISKDSILSFYKEVYGELEDGDDYRCEHCDGSGSVEFLTPPASEQQPIIFPPWAEIDEDDSELEKKAYYGWNAYKAEFLRLNPHLKEN